MRKGASFEAPRYLNSTSVYSEEGMPSAVNYDGFIVQFRSSIPCNELFVR